MNEQPQTPWKKSWHGWGARLFLIVLLAAPVFIGSIIFVALVGASPQVLPNRAALLALLVGAAAVIAGLLLRRQLDILFCWLFTWRNARRLVVGAATLATLVALFYTEENWRGRRAWEQCKHDLEAKGEALDWSACIPAPIADEENIIKAPKMAEWFVRTRGANWNSNVVTLRTQPETLKWKDTKEPVFVARAFCVSADSTATNGADAVVQFSAPDAPESLRRYILGKIGPYAVSTKGDGVLLRQPLSQIKPGVVAVRARRSLGVAEVLRLLPTNSIPPELGRLQVKAGVEKNSFQILVAANRTLSAEYYLAASDRCMPDLDLIRQALKRPHLRMDDDYQRPFEIPTVNFVNIRNVAQSAAQRAQCCLLLGRSEQACHELSLIPELRRLLAAKPTTLVSAMIDVAVSGLYANTVAQGFRLQAWREPELITLQEQLRQIDLPSRAVDSFRVEGAAACRTFETASARQIRELYSFGNSRILRVADWEKFTNPRFLLVQFAPRGWVFQNLATAALAKQAAIEAYDVEHQIIQPGVLESATRQVERIPHSPYAILASAALPNYVRATRTTARNQTLVNQALIVCGLERYRLAHGSYPEALDVLVPEFVEKMPPDIIGGQPLKYRRTGDSQFLLYSIGWNEQDDGGVPGKDAETGDWVWTTKSQ